MTFFGMIKCCDPEQDTVLNFHIIAAACFKPPHQFQCPSAGRPAAEAPQSSGFASNLSGTTIPGAADGHRLWVSRDGALEASTVDRGWRAPGQ